MNYLTSLRGIAAFIVIFFHAKHHYPMSDPEHLFWIMHNGFLAVDFFFVMSGFIMAYTYGEKFKSFAVPTYYSFMVKRFARIYPLHLFIIFLFFSIPLILYVTGRSIDEERFALDALLAKLLLVDVWGTGYAFTWNIPSWSISAEWLAYLLFPLIVFPISRINRLLLVPTLILIAILLASIFWGNDLESIGAGISEFGAVRGVLEFSLGVCVFYLSKHHKLTNPAAARIVLIIALVTFYLCVNRNVPDFIFVPLTFAAFLYGLIGFRGWLHKALEIRPLVYLGDISYSVYLLHFFVLEIMTKAFLGNNEIAGSVWISGYVAATIAGSMLTYHFVEMPSRKKIVQVWTNRSIKTMEPTS